MFRNKANTTRAIYIAYVTILSYIQLINQTGKVIYKKWKHLFDADPKTCGAWIMVGKKVPIVQADRCQGCSNCVMACPLNQRLDKQIIEGEAPKSDNVVLRVKNGTCRILNAKLCAEKGFDCRRCEEICPRHAIRVAGVLS